MTEIIERPEGATSGGGRHRRDGVNHQPATVWIPETWGWDTDAQITAEKPLIPTQSATSTNERSDKAHAKTAPGITTHAEWNTSRQLRRSVTVAMVWLIGLIAVGVGYAVSRGTTVGIALPVLPGVVAAGLWACLLMTTPTVVGVRSSVLTVRTAAGVRTFDLALPDLEVAMTENARGGAWRLRLDDGAGDPVIIDGNQVPAEELTPIVTHYRAIADHRRAERDENLR